MRSLQIIHSHTHTSSDFQSEAYMLTCHHSYQIIELLDDKVQEPFPDSFH